MSTLTCFNPHLIENFLIYILLKIALELSTRWHLMEGVVWVVIACIVDYFHLSRQYVFWIVD